MEYLFNLFINYFNYIETIRNLAYQNLFPWIETKIEVLNTIEATENRFRNFNPFTLMVGFLIAFSLMISFLKLLRKIVNNLNSIDKIKENIMRFAINNFSFARKKLDKTREEIKKKVLENMKESKFKKLEWRPNGQDMRSLLNKLSTMTDVDREIINGPHTKITGSIYINDSEISSLVGEIAKIYGYSNLLHPDVFCSARFIETQLIKLGVELFNGDKDKCCGITTTGGTQSIMYACIAYRNRAYKMGIENPEIIVPITAHAAFDKAGDAFNIKIVKIPIDKSYQVDLRKLTRAINRNTVAIVGSFPNFPHGVSDDIEKLSEIALRYKVGLHVDACLGGLLAAFYGSSNIKIPKFDFRLPGVTTISTDFHKYGLCPKGVSIVLYRDRDLRKHQYFIYPRFMGGIYPSPGFEGSRTPVFTVSAYAIMLFLGKNRFINQAKAIHEAVLMIKNFVKKNLEELEVIGDPQICSIAITGKNVALVFDQMTQRGWHLNYINNPIGLSLVITSANLANVENGNFTKDLLDSYNFVIENKGLKISEQTKLYGVTLDLPEGIVKENLDIICDCMLD